MTKLSTLIRQINDAISKEDISRFDDLVYELSDLVLDADSFPDDLLNEVLKIIESPMYRKMNKSWYLLKMFEDDIDLLSDEQKRKILSSLLSAFNEFSDPTACFLSVELVVELFNDDRSLDALNKLQTVENELPRSLVAHGYEMLIHDNQKLSERALLSLKSMSVDSSVVVKDQVKEILSKL